MKGSCLCGQVQYEIKQFEPNIANCFCRMCRKTSGSSHGTYGAVLPENFKWLSGEPHIKTYKSSAKAERGFCKECGSSLYYKVRSADSCYEIALGTLDEEPDHFPNANIYCLSRAKWTLGSENLQEFKEGREAS